VGIIGTGVGIRTHLPGFKRSGRAAIVGIVGSNQTRAQSFAEKYDIPRAFGNYQDLFAIPDLDLVCVTTPTPFHYEEVLFALKSGKHVLAEKPLGMNLEQTVSLSQEADKRSQLALIDHQLRFNPYLRKVKELINAGHLGRIYFIRIHQQSTGFSNRSAPWSWSFDETMGGGVRLAMASHLIDLLWFWVGTRKIFSVKGALDVVVPQRENSSGHLRNVLASSFFSANLSLEDSLDVQLSATAAALGDGRFDFSIFGTDGELHFDLANKLTGSFLNTRGSVDVIAVSGVTAEEVENKVSIFSGSFIYFAESLARAILDGERQAVSDGTTFKGAIPTQQVLDAILASSLKGETIHLNGGYESNAVI